MISRIYLAVEMKKLLTIISILFITTASYAQTFIVERVIDGDTLKLINGEVVQLIGVDAPEIILSEDDDPSLIDVTEEQAKELQKWGTDTISLSKMGQEAAEFVKNFFDRRPLEVELEIDVQERDKYGRLFAYVYSCPTASTIQDMNKIIFKRGEINFCYMLNALIVDRGYATPMTIPPNTKHADLFQELYQEARDNKRGLWKDNQEAESGLLFKKFEPEVQKFNIPMH